MALCRTTNRSPVTPKSWALSASNRDGLTKTLQEVQSRWAWSTVRRHGLEKLVCSRQVKATFKSVGPSSFVDLNGMPLNESQAEVDISSLLEARKQQFATSRGRKSKRQGLTTAAGRGFDAPLSDRVNSQRQAGNAGEYFKSLGDTVGKMLRGVPVYFIGDDGDGNAAVAEEVAPALGYVPFQTAKLIQQTTGTGLASLAAEEGPQGIAEAEASVVAELSTFVRCAVGTIGGGQGAAADPTRWNHLHGGICVWLDSSSSAASKSDGASSKGPQKLGYTKCDVVIRFSLPEDATWQPKTTRAVAEGVLEGIKKLLTDNEHFAGKKSLYVRSGCRGDWPDLAEPGAEVTQQQSTQSSGPVKEVVLGEQKA